MLGSGLTRALAHLYVWAPLLLSFFHTPSNHFSLRWSKGRLPSRQAEGSLQPTLPYPPPLPQCPLGSFFCSKKHCSVARMLALWSCPVVKSQVGQMCKLSAVFGSVLGQRRLSTRFSSPIVRKGSGLGWIFTTSPAEPLVRITFLRRLK